MWFCYHSGRGGWIGCSGESLHLEKEDSSLYFAIISCVTWDKLFLSRSLVVGKIKWDSIHTCLAYSRYLIYGCCFFLSLQVSCLCSWISLVCWMALFCVSDSKNSVLLYVFPYLEITALNFLQHKLSILLAMYTACTIFIVYLLNILVLWIIGEKNYHHILKRRIRK